jgi:hypothetical protein
VIVRPTPVDEGLVDAGEIVDLVRETAQSPLSGCLIFIMCIFMVIFMHHGPTRR